MHHLSHHEVIATRRPFQFCPRPTLKPEATTVKMVSLNRLAATLASVYCCAEGLATGVQGNKLTVVDPGKRDALQDLVRSVMPLTKTCVLTWWCR